MSLTPLDLTPLDGALQRLGQIEADLGARLLERHETSRAALVALVARRHVALLGPPGTAKSELVTQLAARVAPPGGGGLRTFLRLLTRFTTPEELIGPLSVAGLKNDDYRRITTGMLRSAGVDRTACSTSRPLTLGSFRSSSTTAGLPSARAAKSFARFR